MTSRYRAGQRVAAIISELQDQGLSTSEIALELQQRGVLMRGAAADPVADLCDNVRDIVADFAAAVGQPADEVTALRARAESAERRLRITAALIIKAIGSVGPEDAEDAARRLWDVSVERDALRTRAKAAEAEVARLRAAIAETLRLANVYAGVAAHNAEAEPETSGEAWRSPYMATMRELRRALRTAP